MTLAHLDYIMPRAFILFALIFTFVLGSYVGFTEGYRWGCDNRPTRFVPLSEVMLTLTWKDEDGCWHASVVRGSYGI